MREKMKLGSGRDCGLIKEQPQSEVGSSAGLEALRNGPGADISQPDEPVDRTNYIKNKNNTGFMKSKHYYEDGACRRRFKSSFEKE